MPVDMKWLAEEFEEWEKDRAQIIKRGYYRLQNIDKSMVVVVVDSNFKKVRELKYGGTYNFSLTTGELCPVKLEQEGVLVSADEDDNFIFMSYGRKVVVGLKDILHDNPKTVS